MGYEIAHSVHKVASAVAAIAAIVIGIEVDPMIGLGIAAATASTFRPGNE